MPSHIVPSKSNKFEQIVTVTEKKLSYYYQQYIWYLEAFIFSFSFEQFKFVCIFVALAYF